MLITVSECAPHLPIAQARLPAQTHYAPLRSAEAENRTTMVTNASPNLRSIARGAGAQRPVYNVASSCRGIALSIIALTALVLVLLLV